MKKALIVTTVSGFVPQFEMNNVKILQFMGYEVHYASNFHTPVYGSDNQRLNNSGIVCHQVDFVRSPFRILSNIRAYHQLEKIMEHYSFDLLHCHTPMGGVIGRLAARSKKIYPVIYTVHGFHFYKGASFPNWLFFYPIEWFLARYTDQLITITKEDYKCAQGFPIRGSVTYLKGVGIALNHMDMSEKKHDIREEIGIPEKAIMLLSIGELNRNKNHQIVVRALGKLQREDLIYVICGKGKQEKKLKKLANRLRLEKQVKFLGYRTDVFRILYTADIYILPSYREGLSVSLMEAMAAELPVICSDIRGNRDLIKDKTGGYLVSPHEIDDFIHKITQMCKSKNNRLKMGSTNKIVVQEYSKEHTAVTMRKIYGELEKSSVRKRIRV